MNLEGRGVPTVAVATVEFITAAEAQGKSLGFDPALLYIEHPIQDRTPAEMVNIAQQAVPHVLAMLTR